MADAVKSRYGRSKTRTGCVTCKAQLTIVSYVPTADGSLSAQPATALREQRALAFFQHETAPEFSGLFSRELWSRFMLLVAHHQSSVKHALVALGTLHERFATTGDTSHQGLTSEYALQHYNKAINGVIAIRDTKREDAAEIALVSCILFSCLESLRGYFQSAITHLLSGIRIMHDLQKSSVSGGHHAYIPQAIIRALFLQMDSQIMNIAGYNVAAGIPLASEVELCLPVCYASPDDAMADLIIIYNLATHLLYQAEMVVRDHGAGYPILDELKQQRARYHQNRIRWQEAFQTMLLNNATGLHPRDPRCMILDVHNNALGIILSVDFVDPETDFDQFADVFGAPRGPARITPSFSLTMGVVSILWLAAARCRSPPIRYKALSLLKSCNRREGMWDSRIAAEIAEKLVAIEEAANMQQQQQPSGDGDGDDIAVQDDIMRVKTVKVRFGPESTGAASYSFMNSIEAYERDQRGVQVFNELMTWE
ncbi:hypothetical protein DV736_g3130, partial [Chaetothyriales sp. CBS 134916]